jgi:uncharacterized protein YjbJ (UPF0337 family)
LTSTSALHQRNDLLKQARRRASISADAAVFEGCIQKVQPVSRYFSLKEGIFMSMPNKDQVKGFGEKVKGAVKENIGRATNDPQMEEEGASERAKGDLRQGFGDVKQDIGDAVKRVGDAINK